MPSDPEATTKIERFEIHIDSDNNNYMVVARANPDVKLANLSANKVRDLVELAQMKGVTCRVERDKGDKDRIIFHFPAPPITPANERPPGAEAPEGS